MELPVVRRLRVPTLEPLLPLIALVGHVDRELLRIHELPEVWSEVAAKAARHPDPTAAALLRLRGLAGVVATSDAVSAGQQSALAHGLWSQVFQVFRVQGGLGPDEVAALVAAMEALVEQAERAPALLRRLSLPARLADLTRLTEACEVDDLAAFAYALEARVHALRDRHARALELFRRALQRAPDGPASSWSDWRPPEDLRSRLRLELVRALHPAFLTPEQALSEAGRWGPA